MHNALVGPVTRWLELPSSAATTHVTIDVYRPYTGGSPAISA